MTDIRRGKTSGVRSFVLGTGIFVGALSTTYFIATYDAPHLRMNFIPIGSDIQMVDPVSMRPPRAIIPAGSYESPADASHG